MTDDYMIAGLLGAASELNLHEQPWVLGVGRLVGAPLPVPDPALVRRAFDISSEVTSFPSGPLSYQPGGYDVGYEQGESRRIFRLSSPGLPQLRMNVSWAPAGFVSVAFSNDTRLPGSSRAGLLLADFESVLADTYVMCAATAYLTRYSGLIDFAFTVFDERPDPVLDLYAIHEVTGELHKTSECLGGITLIEHMLEFNPGIGACEVHDDMFAVACRVAPHFGVTWPQLVTPMEAGDPAYSAVPLGKRVS